MKSIQINILDNTKFFNSLSMKSNQILKVSSDKILCSFYYRGYFS